MTTFTTADFTSAQSVSLVQEMNLVGIQDAPLLSLLTAKGNVGKAGGRIQTWVERALDASNASVPEGLDPITNTVKSGRRELSNPLEIFLKSSKVSGTAQAIANGTLTQEIQARLIEIKVAMEKAMVTGNRADGSTGDFVRHMQGLENWATTANTVTATSLSENAIKSAVRKLFDNGTNTGDIVAVMNADMKELVDSIYADKFSYQHNVDVGFGANSFGLKVDAIQTNYGTLYILLERNASANTITVANTDYLHVDYLRAPHFEPLAKTGDADGGFVVAEATLRVDSPLAVSKLVIGTASK